MSPAPVAARVAVIAAILAGIAVVIDFRAVARLLDWPLFVAMLLMQPAMAAAWWISGWRFALLLPPAERPSVLVACKAMLLANNLNLVLPARIGEVVKASYLHQHAGVPLAHGLGAVVVEKLQDFAVIAAIAVCAVVAAGVSTDFRLAYAAAVIGALAVGFMLVIRTRWERMLSMLPQRVETAILPRISGVARAMREHRSSSAMGATLLIWAFNFLAGWTFVGQQHLGALTFSQYAVVFAATLLAGAIPGLPGGFGAYEAAAVLVLTGFGFSREAAFAFGLVLHVGQILLGVVLAVLVAASESTGIAALVRTATTKDTGSGR
jgi:glycosyltransferase 2 family protein